MSQCASTRRKRRTRLSFRTLVRTLPPSGSLLSPPRIPSLAVPHPFSFSTGGASLPSFTASTQTHEADLTLSPWRTKAGLLAAFLSDAAARGEVFKLLSFFIPDGRFHLCGTCIVLCGERLIRASQMHGTFHTLPKTREGDLYKSICLHLSIILF